MIIKLWYQWVEIECVNLCSLILFFQLIEYKYIFVKSFFHEITYFYLNITKLYYYHHLICSYHKHSWTVSNKLELKNTQLFHANSFKWFIIPRQFILGLFQAYQGRSILDGNNCAHLCIFVIIFFASISFFSVLFKTIFFVNFFKSYWRP